MLLARALCATRKLLLLDELGIWYTGGKSSPYSPGYTSDFLGIPIDLGYQLRDFFVSVLTWKMGLRIREILIAIPNNSTKFSLHFRFLQALQGEHAFPLPDMILKVENMWEQIFFHNSIIMV